ncbi:hypothetical protein [uncultured Trichococcus sp.]|jgi:hypothetical protein|nr:hypothetical protein [uncultured Trichococcus sp.]
MARVAAITNALFTRAKQSIPDKTAVIGKRDTLQAKGGNETGTPS